MNMFMGMLFEILWCSLCVDVKIRRREDVRTLAARDRRGMLYRRETVTEGERERERRREEEKMRR